MNTKRGTALVWATLIIAIIALIIAWAAYNRTGVDLEDRIDAAVENAMTDIDVDFKEAEQEIREETSEALQEGSDELEEAAEDTATSSQ